jgi:hypothetical protein
MIKLLRACCLVLCMTVKLLPWNSAPCSDTHFCCLSALAEEVWPYVSLDNIMDSITLHSSNMFVDLLHSLRWNPAKTCKMVTLAENGAFAQLRTTNGEETSGQGTVLGLREYSKTEVHSWTVRFEQTASLTPANFLVGVAPPTMDLNKSLGEEGCGIGECGRYGVPHSCSPVWLCVHSLVFVAAPRLTLGRC